MAKERRQRGARDEEEVGFNMTPMIDVVFNLIIFFMVITDMTQKDLEYLILPKAQLALEDKGEQKDRLIVNIVNPRLKDMQGRVDPNKPPIFYRGRQVASIKDLRARLRRDANPMLRENQERVGPDGEPMAPLGHIAGEPVYPSNKPLLVRCDQGQIFGWVQVVMQAVSFMPGQTRSEQLTTSPLIYKLETAVAEPSDTKEGGG